MEAAVYGLIGTAIGAVITLLTGVFNNRHQLALRRIELAEQARQARVEADRKERAERLARYAGFLSSYWEAERYTCEILDYMEYRGPEWAERVDEIVELEAYQKALSSLNDGTAWISLLSADPRAEEAAVRASRIFDDLVDLIDRARVKGVAEEAFDLSPVRARLGDLQQEIRKLSALLRDDLHRAADAAA